MCKRYTFLFCLFFFCSSQTSFAQKLIALHHGGAASFFTTLPDAYNAAVNGDTIYLPGGSFNGFSLQKSLTLIGVGHHPDSTSATGQTILSYLYIYAGGNNSIITSIFFTDPIQPLEAISGLVISRCYLNKGFYFNSGSQTNWIISENWIGNNPSNNWSIYDASGSSNNIFISNNIIHNRISTLTSSEISNNIFINGPVYSNSSIFRNNIFSGINYVDYVSNSQWYNNLNSGINGGPNGNSNTGSDNYLDNVPLTAVFVNYNSGNTFYQNDFHVVNQAYLGNDGTPVGIYGGAFPWKVGSLPFNPHIRAKTISSTTNPDGTLHINITVKAQGN